MSHDTAWNRFEEWDTASLANECWAQAKTQLDPEFSHFMVAVANRLSLLRLKAQLDAKERNSSLEATSTHKGK